MAYDGIQNNARVDNLGNRKLYTKVVDQVLTSPTVATRMFSGGQPWETGKTMDITMDVVSDGGQFQWITGLEQLNLAATQTTVTTSYAHAAGTQPQVSVMLESMANVGDLGIITLDDYKYRKAAATVLQQIGSSVYGTGAGNQMLGLEAIIDDGTNNATIGGVSRSTYSQLNAYKTTAVSGKLTLALMGTTHDNVRAAGLASERPNIGYTTKANFTLYEQLLSPNVRAGYDEVGYDRVPLKSKWGSRSSVTLRNSAGFNGLSYRDMHIIDDDFAPTGTLYFVNEDYLHWYGRSIVADEYKGTMEHISFGSSSSYEGTGQAAIDEMPSEHHGWFYQKPQPIPNQAGMAARFWVIGQYIGESFRRQGKILSITGV